MKKFPWKDFALWWAISLVTLALVGVILTQGIRARQKSAAEDTAHRLLALMPEVSDTVPDDRINMTLPAMEVDGVNYCGLLEVPSYSVSLPLRAEWEADAPTPRRYYGSIYDRSLILGGPWKQMEFLEKITVDDPLSVTDMAGERYGYRVKKVFETKEISPDFLTEQEGDLVIFAKQPFGKYVIALCDLG